MDKLPLLSRIGRAHQLNMSSRDHDDTACFLFELTPPLAPLIQLAVSQKVTLQDVVASAVQLVLERFCATEILSSKAQPKSSHQASAAASTFCQVLQIVGAESDSSVQQAGDISEVQTTSHSTTRLRKLYSQGPAVRSTD